MRILIVEDESVIAFLLERQLKILGCEVVAKVIFGEEAEPACSRHQPDLVLMDIRLAGAMDGLAAARAILTKGMTRIAFMTAYGTERIKQEIAEIRHVAYLEKPISMEQLRSLVNNLRF